MEESSGPKQAQDRSWVGWWRLEEGEGRKMNGIASCGKDSTVHGISHAAKATVKPKAEAGA